MDRSEESLERAAQLLLYMRSSDPDQKLTAAREIPFISEQIGPERTVNEFLPFLSGMRACSSYHRCNCCIFPM